ncbi:MFS transporter [Nocardia carnea]|uniref:MFS transporter n=1 Tax=Nocardia carnea TaxID=37328 RepID=UPI0024560948|nr:MFS transporter [Nocardia carnea]
MTSANTRLSRAHIWLLTLSSLAVALVIAAMAALYTALPEIAADTGASQQQLTWVVDGYTLALACLVLFSGAFGDRFGRRIMMVLGLGIFAIASAVPLFLDAPTWIIGSRAVAGIGAALVMPSTLSLLTGGFPAEKRGVAVGLWAGVVSGGAVIGILGSGLLLQVWSWQAIFLAMTIAGVVLAIAGCTVPESVDELRPPLDFWGGITSSVAVGAVVVGAIEAPVRGWSDPVVLGLFGGGILAAVGFATVELRVPHPLLDVRLFADRGFGSGAVSVGVQFLVAFGYFLLFVQYMQLIFGYSPLMSALAMAPMIAPLIGISVFAPRLAERFGLRLPTLVGLLCVGTALILVSRTTVDSTYIDVLWPLLILSTGLGLCTAPATAAIINGTPPEKHGVASAVNDASREVGAAIGIAVSGSILAVGYTDRIAPALPGLPEQARGPVGDSLAAALEVTEQAGPVAAPLADFAKEAFVHGAQQASLALGVLTVVMAFVLGAWAPGRVRKTTSDSTSDDQALTNR